MNPSSLQTRLNCLERTSGLREILVQELTYEIGQLESRVKAAIEIIDGLTEKDISEMSGLSVGRSKELMDKILGD